MRDLYIFIGPTRMVEKYKEDIERLRREGIDVLIMKNEEVATPRLRTPIRTFVGHWELDNFFGKT
jgi:hypothetical protein